LLTLVQAAARLGVAPATLRAQIRRKRLSATKLGRDWLVEPEEVQRYARESRRSRDRDQDSVND
jgi:excisionase family DNA binding protein